MHNKRNSLNWTRLLNFIIRSAVKATVPTTVRAQEKQLKNLDMFARIGAKLLVPWTHIYIVLSSLVIL